MEHKHLLWEHNIGNDFIQYEYENDERTKDLPLKVERFN